MSGADTTVLFVVKQGRKVTSAWSLHLKDGASSSSGPVDDPGEVDADVTFTVAPDDIADVRSGTLALSVGFMRGQVKTAGETGAVLAVLPVLDGPDLRQARQSLLADGPH